MVRLISVTVVFSSVCVCVRTCIYMRVSTPVDTLILCTCMHVRTYNGHT